MQIAIYARASARADDPETQLETLRAFVAVRGWPAPVEFVDHGVQGPATAIGLSKLLRALARRDVEAIACIGLDRLGRSIRHLIEIASVLDRAGAALIVLAQEIDTTQDTGFIRALLALGELEKESFREHTIAGLHRAGEEGVRMGRPRVLDAAGRAQAQRLLDSGRSQREVASMLKIGRTTLQREFGTVPRSKPSASDRRSARPRRAGRARKDPSGRR